MEYTASHRWGQTLKQNMDEHFNCSENLIVCKKKNRQLALLLEITNLSHTVNIKKVRKKVIEKGFFFSLNMHLNAFKFTTLLFFFSNI